MSRKDNESIIPPGVDSLPNNAPSAARKKGTVQRTSKSESGAVRSVILDKCSDSKPIHKASPMRKALPAVDSDDSSDVDRLTDTLKKNRRKTESFVPQSGGHCSPTEVQQVANSTEPVEIGEKSLQSSSDLSHHRTSESDSNELLLAGSISDKKDLNNGNSFTNVVVAVTEKYSVTTRTGEKCKPEFGPAEDVEQLNMASEHSTQDNTNTCISNESITGSAPAQINSDEGSVEFAMSDVRKKKAHIDDVMNLYSSDDSSVEVIKKDKDDKNQLGHHQSRPDDMRATHLNQNTCGIAKDGVNSDKRNISREFEEDEPICSEDDVDEVNDWQRKKKIKTESCLESSSGTPKLSAAEVRVRDLLSLARSNNAMEIDLRRLSPTGQEVYCALGDIDSNPHPAPFPERLSEDEWCFDRKNYLKVPWSTKNVEKILANGSERKERSWVNVRLALLPVVTDGLLDITDFKVAVKTYNQQIKFDGLIEYFDSLTDEKKQRMLTILTATAGLVLKGRELFNKGVRFLSIPELRPSATFSREQCACLLANFFFCTFPEPNSNSNLNCVNMNELLSVPYIANMKMEFFLTYFEAVTNSMPIGCVTFARRTLPYNKLPEWEKLDRTLKQVETSSIAIEDLGGCLQVDFANQYIGGGVLGYGSVQEEIRFLICPEMIVSMLICPKLENTEAVHIYGAQRFSSYTGYDTTFKWKLLDSPAEKRDIYGRTTCELVAIDAIQFSANRSNQYKEENLRRELNKAYAGFISDCENPRPVATGNWGCGVFNGDREYKSLIQIMAASLAGRDIIYVHLEDYTFGRSLYKVNRELLKRNVTVGMLYNRLKLYRAKQGVSAFDFVMDKTHVYDK